jgi:serine/threonine protein kinase
MKMTRADFENLYQDRQFVGSGGFAEVYKTFDHAKGCYVALKSARVRPEHRQYTLQREVELVNKLPLHQNVARYESCYRFDMGLAGEMDFAVLEFYEDGNLEQFLNTHELTAAEISGIVTGILRGVAFLHDNNITHRDLKSQNILLKREFGIWSPKIADFGLAREVFDQVVTDTSIGISYAYAAPEQIKGQKISKTVDIWAAGVIIYRIIAGELPFKNQGSEAQNSQAQSELIRKITTLELPEKLNHIAEPYQRMIRRCLVLDPTARAQTAQELLLLMDARHVSQAEDNEKTIYVDRPTPPPPPVERRAAPPPLVVLEDDKTEIIRKVDEFISEEYKPYVPPAPPIYVPPVHYATPKADVTQYQVRTPEPAPPPPPPVRPALITGEPKQAFKWIWVLIPLLLAGVGFGIYKYLTRPKITAGVLITPKTLSSPVDDDWKKPYAEAVLRGATDSHEEGHHHTFYLFAVAADYAIKTGKAAEMSQKMINDVDTPTFKRLNHGHQEWVDIRTALAQKDRNKLAKMLNQKF